MNLGPYKIKNGRLAYKGNKVFKPIYDVRGLKAPDLEKRHIEVQSEPKKWEALIRIWDGIFKASNEFMQKKNALLFDLPITTRMISSPGALTGTIASDVDPFEIKFFNKNTFLTQSSQLYLEFAITNPKINSVYCWEKSFRREKADFRHLPEFTHIEFESNIKFKENLRFQKEYLQYLIDFLIRICPNELFIFLTNTDIDALQKLAKLKFFKQITFHEAFKLLSQETKNKKYKKVTVECHMK